MNDTENFVPTLSLNDENAHPGNAQKSLRRKPLRATTQKLGKVEQPPQRARRRALGDITNSVVQQPKPLQKHKLSTPSNKLQIWRDEEVPEPEIIPPAPPRRPYQPAPLFSASEIAEMQRELEEEDDDDATDDFGRPFMTADPVPVPPPPYRRDEDCYDDGGRRDGLDDDYFSPDQMFRKEELPTLELA